MSGLGFTFLRRGNLAHPTAGSDYIKFADAEVERILMSKGVSSDGVGITKDDAAKVTDIGIWFQNNTEIETFYELRYFTGIIGLSQNADGKGPFRMCTNLSAINMSENLKYVRRASFEMCSSLVSINLQNVEYLGGFAFSQANLSGYSVNMPMLTEAENISGGRQFADTKIQRIENLGKLRVIPGTSWTTGFASNCKELLSVNIPDSTTQILNAAFYGCSKLEEVNISSNSQLQSIGQNAFAGCENLKKLNLPASITNIVQYALYGCTSLGIVTIEATSPPTLGGNNNGLSNAIIYVPDASVDAYKGAAGWSSFASKIKPLSDYQG